MKIAFAGLDSMYWPSVYADIVADAPDADLIGYSDLGVGAAEIESELGETRESFAEDAGIDRFTDLDAALDAADGVIVCTRNTRMPEVVVEALEAGCHAFAVKPVGVDVDDLAGIREALSPSTVFTAGRSAHGYPPVRTLLSAVRDGRIGDVHTMRVMHNHGRLREWGAGTWYADPEEGNGCNYLGWYPVHAAVEVLGPVAEVWGHAQRMPAWDETEGREWETPDHFKAFARHEDGRLSTVEVYCDVGDWEIGGIEAEIVGTEGVARYAAPGDEVRVHADGGVERIPFDREAREAEINAYDLERWIDACEGRGDPVIAAEDALHVAAVGAAWNEASRAEDRRATVELLP